MLKKAISQTSALILILTLASCSKSITIDIMVPAAIDVPQEINTVVVVNRSLPAKGKGGDNFFEGLISGESIAGDKKGSEECVKSLVKFLNDMPRFNAVLYTGPELPGTGTSTFPVALEWEKVSILCARYNADMLAALEVFDTDNYIAESASRNIHSGWRLYYPATETILDERFLFDEQTSSAGDGFVAKRLGQRKEIKEAGSFVGEQYGFHISPGWIAVKRYYYVKKELKPGRAFVLNEDWEGAKLYWQSIAEAHSKTKIQAMACYNIAFANEMTGSFEEALEWAKRAGKMGLEAGHDYAWLLAERIRDVNLLEQQLPDSE